MLELLRQYGWNATSFQVLQPGFRDWFDPAGDACGAYVDTGGAWGAAGGPIASPERLPAGVADFQHQLEASVGLVPSEMSSGEKQRKGRITKTGNARVR